MDIEVIAQELNKQFTIPLPEFYQRKIIFWYDEEREFEDQLDQLTLEGAKLAVLTGSNTFAVKKLLCEEDRDSNYLVYDPRVFTTDDDNWLINVQLYSEEFRADLISIWINEMGLPATPVVRSQVKRYRNFFRAKERRDALQKLKGEIVTGTQLELAVMAVLCGCSITYKLKLNGGDMKSVQGDSGHAQMKMVADVYSHIIDEDRCLNAQRFEAAFYAPKQSSSAAASVTPEQPAIKQKEEDSMSDTAKILELLKTPETAALLKQRVSAL